MTLAGFYGSEGEQPEMKLGWDGELPLVSKSC